MWDIGERDIVTTAGNGSLLVLHPNVDNVGDVTGKHRHHACAHRERRSWLLPGGTEINI